VKHPLIEYTNLLHRSRDPEAKVVKNFVEKHKDDEVLMRRIKKLNELFEFAKTL